MNILPEARFVSGVRGCCCRIFIRYFHTNLRCRPWPGCCTKLQNCIPACFRNQPRAVRGQAAGAGPGHALRGHLQREARQGRHQGGRAHQAAPQGEQQTEKPMEKMLFEVNLLQMIIKLTSREVINITTNSACFSLILSANSSGPGAAPSSSSRRAQ